MKLYKNKEGKKMYPVCNWEKNQHKLYNAYDRIVVAVYDGKAECDELEKIQKALDAFNSFVVNGMVYATYEDGLLIKDYIWAYNARH